MELPPFIGGSSRDGYDNGDGGGGGGSSSGHYHYGGGGGVNGLLGTNGGIDGGAFLLLGHNDDDMDVGEYASAGLDLEGIDLQELLLEDERAAAAAASQQQYRHDPFASPQRQQQQQQQQSVLSPLIALKDYLFRSSTPTSNAATTSTSTTSSSSSRPSVPPVKPEPFADAPSTAPAPPPATTRLTGLMGEPILPPPGRPGSTMSMGTANDFDGAKRRKVYESADLMQGDDDGNTLFDILSPDGGGGGGASSTVSTPAAAAAAPAVSFLPSSTDPDTQTSAEDILKALNMSFLKSSENNQSLRRRQDARRASMRTANGTPATPTPVADPAAKKRENHASVERRRRDNMNDCIAEFARMVPDLSASSKLNKGLILRRAVEHMEALIQANAKLEEQLNVAVAQWTLSYDKAEALAARHQGQGDIGAQMAEFQRRAQETMVHQQQQLHKYPSLQTSSSAPPSSSSQETSPTHKMNITATEVFPSLRFDSTFLPPTSFPGNMPMFVIDQNSPSFLFDAPLPQQQQQQTPPNIVIEDGGDYVQRPKRVLSSGTLLRDLAATPPESASFLDESGLDANYNFQMS